MFTENARSEFVHYDEEVDAPSGPKYDMINKTAARCAALLLPGWRLTAALPLIAALCGGIAGLLPAVRAASMDPIEAMRK